MKTFLLLIGVAFSLTGRGISFEQDLLARSLLYFQENTHPTTGLVRDKAHNFVSTQPVGWYRVASIAATGFGMAVFAHAAKAGQLPWEETRQRVRSTLGFVEHHLAHFHGWLFHFVDWETGRRAGHSEYSTIDTALFLSGAYYAAAIFSDPEIQKTVERLHARLDFKVMQDNGGEAPGKSALSMGFTPEFGFIPFDWDVYSEHLMLYLLGLGHPSHPLSTPSWKAWKRMWVKVAQGPAILGGGLPLFVHQYNFLFLDPHSIPLKNVDLSENSNRATLLDWWTCHKGNFETYRQGYWGLSASESAHGYQAFSPNYHDGTVCPGCVGASAPFNLWVLDEMKKWSVGPHGGSLYGRYGFIDAFNLDPEWYSSDSIGITVGALYLAVVNATEKGAIWNVFKKQPFLIRALSAAKIAEGVSEWEFRKPSTSESAGFPNANSGASLFRPRSDL